MSIAAMAAQIVLQEFSFSNMNKHTPEAGGFKSSESTRIVMLSASFDLHSIASSSLRL